MDQGVGQASRVTAPPQADTSLVFHDLIADLLFGVDSGQPMALRATGLRWPVRITVGAVWVQTTEITWIPSAVANEIHRDDNAGLPAC